MQKKIMYKIHNFIRIVHMKIVCRLLLLLLNSSIFVES